MNGPLLIEHSRHCPLCGSGDYVMRPDGTRACPSCGHRDFHNPVAAVAVLIEDAMGRLFLIRRAREPARGLWAFPGGFVDAGESLEQAARREVAEETGLEAGHLTYLSSAPNLYFHRGLGRPVCDVFFHAKAAGGEVRMQAGEVSDTIWQPAAAIAPATLAFDSMRHALGILLSNSGSKP